MSINSDSKPLLKVDNLSVIYHNQALTLIRNQVVKAVKNVSFTVFPGECYAIVGESGGGKTSIAHSILGFIKPSDGTIIFDDCDIWQLSKNKLRQLRPLIQPVFQDYNNALNPLMRIREILSEPLLIKGIRSDANAQLQKSLEIVGLNPEILTRYPNQLSGGQKQRVVLAKALIMKPKLLILDEPVSSQDISIGAQIINLLRHLQVTVGLSYLLISHNLSVVRLLADRIAIMQNGVIIEQNTVKQLFENPAKPYTKNLIKASIAPD